MFSKDVMAKDGHQFLCKGCNKDYYQENKASILISARKWREKNGDRKRERDREYNRNNRDRILERLREYYRENKEKFADHRIRYAQEHPDAVNAHEMVRQARESGLLVRPGNCFCCGSGELDIQAHHEDYGSPLEVVWLCRSCHRKLHASRWRSSATG